MYIYSKFHYRISCKIIRRMLMICHTSMLFRKNLIRKYDSRTRFNPDIYNILRMFVRRSWIRNFNRCSNWSGNISLFQRQADNIYRIQKCKYITILTKIRERDCYCFKNILIFWPQTSTLSYILVRPSAGLLFPAVDYLRIYLLENLAKDHQKLLKTFKNTKIVVLDCKHIDKIDFTAARVWIIILSSWFRIWPGFYFFEPFPILSSTFVLQR